MKVRKANEKDLGRIAEILVFTKRSTYRPIFQNDEVSFNVITVLNVIDEVKEIGIENTYVYDDGIVKGMTRLKHNENRFEYCELYVDPFFQNEGVGSALMDFNEEQAKLANEKEVFLWVLEKNAHAINFYEKKGFVNTQERKEFATTGQYLVKFKKEI
ncbi:GNAT family N-acetyltransferase [bacterium]|nr:GNAT family N-acetyltransferase [bacterium]